MSVAQKIKEYLNDHGIRPSFVAEKVGMNPELFKRSLDGTRKMSAEEFVGVCRVLGLELDYFLSTGYRV